MNAQPGAYAVTVIPTFPAVTEAPAAPYFICTGCDDCSAPYGTGKGPHPICKRIVTNTFRNGGPAGRSA